MEVSVDVQQISEKIIADIPVTVKDIPEKIRVFPSPQTVSSDCYWRPTKNRYT